MKKIIIIISALIASVQLGSAQDASALYISSDPARTGTAGVSMPYAASSYAADWNASAISLSESTMSVGIAYGSWSPDLSKNQILGFGGYYRMGKLGVGLFGRRISDSQAITTTNENSVVTGTFKPSDIVVGLGASYAINDALSVGASAKYISSAIADDISESTVCFDLNATYKLDALNVAAGVSNTPLSTAIKAGAAYSIAGLTPAVEFSYNMDGGMGIGVAAEYDIAGYAFVRGGYHYASDEAMPPSFASLGIGAHLAGISLDASYLLASDTIGNSFLVGLSYSF